MKWYMPYYISLFHFFLCSLYLRMRKNQEALVYFTFCLVYSSLTTSIKHWQCFPMLDYTFIFHFLSFLSILELKGTKTTDSPFQVYTLFDLVLTLIERARAHTHTILDSYDLVNKLIYNYKIQCPPPPTHNSW